MTDIKFLANLSLVLGHTVLLESKGHEPIGVAWVENLLSDFLRDKPKVPSFKPVDTTKEQAGATAGNIANFDKISELAGKTNTFNQDQLSKMIEAGMPGFHKLSSSVQDRISSETSGELPQDVVDQIRRNTAQGSLAGGFNGGGTMGGNLTARDLGLTSLDLVNKGIDAGTRWLSTARAATVAPGYDPSSMFISPALRIGVAGQNNENKWNRDWLKNQTDATYGTGTILANTLGSLESSIMGAGSSAAGAAAGGAGGGGGGGL